LPTCFVIILVRITSNTSVVGKERPSLRTELAYIWCQVINHLVRTRGTFFSWRFKIFWKEARYASFICSIRRSWWTFALNFNWIKISASSAELTILYWLIEVLILWTRSASIVYKNRLLLRATNALLKNWTIYIVFATIFAVLFFVVKIFRQETADASCVAFERSWLRALACLSCWFKLFSFLAKLAKSCAIIKIFWETTSYANRICTEIWSCRFAFTSISFFDKSSSIKTCFAFISCFIIKFLSRASLTADSVKKWIVTRTIITNFKIYVEN